MRTKYSFVNFGAQQHRLVRYRTRVKRTQNWYDNGPDPCEQSTFPFQKSDRYDNGTISFPCERSLNLLDLDLFYLCLEHSQNNTLWANYYMSPVVIVIDL